MSSRTVAILGGGGFIGKRISAHLADCGWGVLCLARRSVSGLPASVEIVQDSFDEPAKFAPVLDRVETLIHCASSNTVSTSANTPMLEFERDLKVTVALAQALELSADTNVIYISSGGTIYGEMENGNLISETALISPKSYHGAAKVAAESFLMAWANPEGRALTILRPSNVYGPGQVPKPGFGVIPTLLNCVLTDSVFYLRGNPESTRDYLFISDLEYLIDAAMDGTRPDRPVCINASSGNSVSLTNLISIITAVTGMAPKIERVTSVRGDVNHVALDPSRAYSEFGWRASIGIEEGVRRTWKWLKKYRFEEVGKDVK